MIKCFKNKKTKGRKLKIIEKITVNEIFDFLEKHSIRPKISKSFYIRWNRKSTWIFGKKYGEWKSCCGCGLIEKCGIIILIKIIVSKNEVIRKNGWNNKN